MKILVYEHITGSTSANDCEPTLEREGWAMLLRAAGDLARVPGIEVEVLLHESRSFGLADIAVHPVSQADDLLLRMDRSKLDDAWLLIAPEFDGNLSRWVGELERRRIRSLSPSVDVVDLFSDKWDTYERIGSPMIFSTQDVDCLPDAERIVLKPRDGAGSLHTLCVAKDQVRDATEHLLQNGVSRGNLIYQPFFEGTPASIAVVGLEDGSIRFLPVARQQMVRHRIDVGEMFEYQGGMLPLSTADQRRAERLVLDVLAKSPPIRGYVGFDLILGDAHDGSNDAVVEVNPRLTTSYVGYSEWMHRATGDSARMGCLLLGRSVEIPRSVVDETVVRYLPSGETSWVNRNG